LVGLPLSDICSRRLNELDKPHILALAAETGFLLFKEQFPVKFKNKYQRFNAKGRSFVCYYFQPRLIFAGQSL
jgi:hypothetical protein